MTFLYDWAVYMYEWIILFLDRDVYIGHDLQQTDGEVLHPGLYGLEFSAPDTM